MATSGTIGNTRVKTVNIVERAVRRCGLSPASVTAETLSIALEDLFSLLMSISSRGLNLWCVDHQLLPLVEGQATYVLPPGTLEVLNLIHATPARIEGTDTIAATFYQTQFDEAARIVRVGVDFSVAPMGTFEIQTSPDGAIWTTVKIVEGVIGWNWYDLDPAQTSLYFRVFSATLGIIDDLLLAGEVREIPITPFSRDDYSQQPNKTFNSLISTNYYFEKLVEPRITLWPVPGDSTRHLSLFRYRQIQDVGALTDELELPTRWFEAVIWHLALRLSFELPGVDAARRQEVLQMTSSMTFEVEGTETDNAPIYIAPLIGVYTK